LPIYIFFALLQVLASALHLLNAFNRAGVCVEGAANNICS
jgi:hypothetical protein